MALVVGELHDLTGLLLAHVEHRLAGARMNVRDGRDRVAQAIPLRLDQLVLVLRVAATLLSALMARVQTLDPGPQVVGQRVPREGRAGEDRRGRRLLRLDGKQ